IQYQAPYFRELATRESMELVVMFGSRHGLDVSLDKGFGTAFSWDIPLLEGYQHRFLENLAANDDVDAFAGTRLGDPRAVLLENRVDALLVLGWQSLAHVQLMRAARSLGIPLLVRGESNLLRRGAGGLRGIVRSIVWLPVRELVYRAAFHRVASFLVIGSRNADFYRHFGVPERKLHWAPYAVDNARFDLAPAPRSEARRRLRVALGVPEDAVVFVVPAKLIERKRPFDLLEAFAKSRSASHHAHLVYLGEGPQRAPLERAISKHGLKSHVSISGFVNQSVIPDWYAMADCVVLPSDYLETWGLAVNEGMAAGLAAIVSDAVGCAPDLVRDGENGFRFPFADVDALASCLARFAGLPPEQRDVMGQRSRAIVSKFTIERLADATEAALGAAFGEVRPRTE
ncbi:MAG: glycosyltransferase family 4 protein, partial [Gemmatimonadaceae bacterium]